MKEISECMNMQKYYEGTLLDAWKCLGAHMEEDGAVFRTFAPSARQVILLLEDREIPMHKVYNGCFFEVRVPDARPGDAYEYRIYTGDNTYTDHCDPYGFAMELRPDHRSILTDLNTFQFSDEAWMEKRSGRPDEPMNVYELHAGSWRKNGDAWLRYDELADQLVPYLKENGYNFVELMPVSEHPSDESWGYQNTGFFAPTSRYGTPDDLKKLINRLHENDIGVLMDFVPVHFALDAYGLALYDGTALYEYPSQDVGHSEWGSRNFMHSRGEVRSFLASSASYWLEEFHFDGLRMDAVSRLIYWQGDERRGVNGMTVEFIKIMNRELKRKFSDCVLIAEDSTSYPGVTSPVNEGGLGFDYKWDLGWMHDTLEYLQTPPAQRSEQYHKLTFSMMYFYNEKYMLPFSHDEVVHGKASILNKMYGDLAMKFPQARELYLYMMVHPGKKLNFMGNELGQLREWSEKRELDWELLHEPAHAAFVAWIRALNQTYLTHPAFWQWDYRKEGFQWLDCHQEERCLYAIERRSENERVMALFNFSEEEQKDWTFALPGAEEVSLLLSSNAADFGGSQPQNEVFWKLEEQKMTCTLAPFSAALFLITEAEKPEETETEQ